MAQDNYLNYDKLTEYTKELLNKISKISGTTYSVIHSGGNIYLTDNTSGSSQIIIKIDSAVDAESNDPVQSAGVYAFVNKLLENFISVSSQSEAPAESINAWLQNKNGAILAPHTFASQVLTSSGETVEEALSKEPPASITYSIVVEENKIYLKNNRTQEKEIILTIDTALSTESTNPVANKIINTKLNEIEKQVNDCFTSVSNGKELIASAITDKGVQTGKDATFATMADNISKIEGGGQSEILPLALPITFTREFKPLYLKIEQYEKGEIIIE